MIDLRKFKGVYYDLDEIGLALATVKSGPEEVDRAQKALTRLGNFVATIEDPYLGVQSDLNFVGRGLVSQAKAPGLLFDGSQAIPAPALVTAREAHLRLRNYMELLQRAWQVCALDTQWADHCTGAGRTGNSAVH